MINRLEGAVAVGTSLTLALSACGGGEKEKVPTPASRPTAIATSSTTQETPLYELKRTAEGKLVDQGLKNRSDKGIKSVTLLYDATTQGGSIRAEVCFDRKEHFSIMSREEYPNPGWLVDKAYKIDKPGCVVKTPVINLGPKDRSVIYVGAADSADKTHIGMFVYATNSDNFQVKGARLKNQTVKTPVKLRP
jgi:hypothetical protein